MKKIFETGDCDKLQRIIDFSAGMKCARDQSTVNHPFDDDAMKLLKSILETIKEEYCGK